MLSNNQKNCGFGEELVLYLYDECSAEEKKNFEMHLTSCASCIDEFAGFSAARSLVSEWREADFLPLEIPSIVLPQLNEPIFGQPKTLKIRARLWLTDIQRFLNFSPAAYAFGIIALFAVCFGLIVFTQRNLQNNEIAQANKITEPISALQNSGDSTESKDLKFIQPEKDNAATTQLQRSASTAVNSTQNSRRENLVKRNVASEITVIEPPDKSNSKMKVSNQGTNALKIKSNNFESKKPIFAQNNKLPRLNSIEDDEDKSLRLAELLEDDGEAK